MAGLLELSTYENLKTPNPKNIINKKINAQIDNIAPIIELVLSLAIQHLPY
jgi:hypothetical protein